MSSEVSRAGAVSMSSDENVLAALSQLEGMTKKMPSKKKATKKTQGVTAVSEPEVEEKNQPVEAPKSSPEPALQPKPAATPRPAIAPSPPVVSQPSATATEATSPKTAAPEQFATSPLASSPTSKDSPAPAASAPSPDTPAATNRLMPLPVNPAAVGPFTEEPKPERLKPSPPSPAAPAPSKPMPEIKTLRSTPPAPAANPTRSAPVAPPSKTQGEQGNEGRILDFAPLDAPEGSTDSTATAVNPTSELDLSPPTARKKRVRKNSFVLQRAEGEPSHRGIKIGLFALLLVVLFVGGNWVYGKYLAPGGSGDGRDDPGGTAAVNPPSPTENPATPIVPTPSETEPNGGTAKPPPKMTAEQAAAYENELAFLRGRNELTMLADKAINTGSREAYENILKVGEDPDQSRLHDSAQAEALRVQQFYFQSNRPVAYSIPAKEIFRDPSLGSERDLSTYQKIALLKNENGDLPWEMRAKAAFLLASVRDIDAADALVYAIQTDPNLNVVKEAHTTFDQNWGYRGELFDVPRLVEWWKKNRPGSGI